MGTLIKSIVCAALLFICACGNTTSSNKKPLQNKVDWEATPFAFEGCKMYYKGTEFELGWHIQDYEKVFGKGYRRVDAIGSFGHDNIFTFDSVGIMMLGERYGNNAQKDTINQINIVFNYNYRELDYFTEKEGLTDKMQIADNYARPKKFYTRNISINGVVLQLGPQGLSVQEVNRRVANTNASFNQSALKSLWRYHAYCHPETNDSTTVYSLVVDDNPEKIQQMDILKSFGGF